MSQVFEPFRALGLVTVSEVAPSLQTCGTETFITTSIGRTFHLYSLAHLKLVFVGQPEHPSRITHLLLSDPYVFTVCGSEPGVVRIHKRGRLVEQFDCEEAVHTLTSMGDVILVCGIMGKVTIVQCRRRGGSVTPIVERSSFSVHLNHGMPLQLGSGMVHPQTYLNKVMIGASLVNFNSKKVIHVFESLLRRSSGGGDAGDGDEGRGVESLAITCLEPSPAVDVVAVGYVNGIVAFHHLKADKPLFTLRHPSQIRSMSFRTDSEPYLTVVCSDSSVYTWNLETRTLVSKLPHTERITYAAYVDREPLLVTVGSNNSLRVWIFDQSDGSCRVLRERSGHFHSVSKTRFYNDSLLLTCSSDKSFRFLTLRNDAANGEFSKRHRELPAVQSFAWCPLRSRDWADVVTVHKHLPMALLWRTDNNSIAEKELKLTKSKGKPVSCAVSACGNFALVGTSDGIVERFNMQSGLFREHYSYAIERSAVVGLFPDTRNRFVLACHQSGRVVHYPSQSDLVLASGISCCRFNGRSELLAIACDDLHIYLVEELRVVRKFASPHSTRITDISFSPDGRYCLSVSADGSVALFDIVNACCVDAFKTNIPISSCDFDPSGTFLATTHAESSAVFLWSNRMHSGGYFPRSIDVKAIDFELLDQVLPLSTVHASQDEPDPTDALACATEPVEVEDDSESAHSKGSAPKRHRFNNKARGSGRLLSDSDTDASSEDEAVDPGCIRFAGVPRTNWALLSQLDLVRKRNQPKRQSVKVSAPFLLQLTQSSTGDAVKEQQKGASSFFSQPPGLAPESGLLNSSKVLTSMAALDSMHSEITQMLLAESEKLSFPSYSAVLDILRTTSASGLDLELRSLQASNPFVLRAWILFFTNALESKHDFELICGMTNLFLTLHMRELSAIQDDRVNDSLHRLMRTLNAAWASVDRLLLQDLCLTRFFAAHHH